MRFPWTKQVNGKEHARAEREAAQQRLTHAQQHVITPLRDIRRENHVSDVITALIQRKIQREAGRNEPGPAPH